MQDKPKPLKRGVFLSQHKGEEIDIIKELENKKSIINEIIEKYVPRKYDEKSLEFTLGKPRYKYNVEAPNKAIADPIWEFLDRGGKRWRPALFLLVVEALGEDPEKVYDFVLIPELVHNGSLFIDDIEDNSEMRRGRPCSHLIFGTDVAINCGNALYFLPLISLIKNGKQFDDKTIRRVYEIYVQEMINLSFGQAMDIAWHKDMANANNLCEEEYLQMCAYKTGTLARMSAKMAALLAGATNEQIETLGKFAEAIGVAFQIKDDVMNIEGGLGKEYGDDINEGKRTLMVVHTLKKASEKDKKRLIEILDMHTKDKKLIKEAIDILKKYDSLNYAKNFAIKMMKETWVEVDKTLPDSEAKKKLRAFVEYLAAGRKN